jgi:hypothetical protein
MFDEIGRTQDEPEARGYVLSVCGCYCHIGILGTAVHIWRHGSSQPIHLVYIAVYAAVSLLSLSCLPATLRSGPPTKRTFRLRSGMLAFLVVAPIFIRTLS